MEKQNARKSPSTREHCPSCSSAVGRLFYVLESVPVHSVVLLKARQAALDYPAAPIELIFCPACGFIFNAQYDPARQDYNTGYESTQSFSATFDNFSRGLAEDLTESYDLRGKSIIEVGCGMGEFLTRICEMGGNRGLGFDPAYQSGRVQSEADVRFIRDFYSERYLHEQADFIICKMTLEHIGNVTEFVRIFQRNLQNSPETVVFFQVPDVTRVLREVAFWDIYYEHCSYFSAGSLGRLFQHCGFDILRLSRVYDDQYLMIEARLGQGAAPLLEDDLAITVADVTNFRQRVAAHLAAWRSYFAAQHAAGRRVVLWGAGSKGVAFLTTLGLYDEIAYCVDINPHKHGSFMAGTGQQIVAPDFLKHYRPHLVLVMNPIYQAEIESSLRDMGLTAEIIPVNRLPAPHPN